MIDVEENDDVKLFAETCLNISMDELNKIKTPVKVSSPKIILQTYADSQNTYYFLLNTDRKNKTENITVDFGCKTAIQEWSAVSGEKYMIAADIDKLTVSFEPGEMKIFVDCSECIDLSLIHI